MDVESKADISYLRPTVTPSYTEIDLLITYSDALKLYVLHKTNKILTNSRQGLTRYLSSHKLFLQTTCDRCYTQIESRYLDFNLDKAVIAAVGISSERLMVTDRDNLYQMNSYFMADKTNLIVDKLDKTRPFSPTSLELPLLPKYRFRDKKHFLEKIKTYVLFS